MFASPPANPFTEPTRNACCNAPARSASVTNSGLPFVMVASR